MALVYSPIYDMMVPADLVPPAGFADSVPGYLGYTGPTNLVQKLNPLQILAGGYMDDEAYRQAALRQGVNAFDIQNAILLRNGRSVVPPPIPSIRNDLTPIAPWIVAGPTASMIGSPMPPIPVLPPDTPVTALTPLGTTSPFGLSGSHTPQSYPISQPSASIPTQPRKQLLRRGDLRRMLERAGAQPSWLSTATDRSLIGLFRAYRRRRLL